MAYTDLPGLFAHIATEAPRAYANGIRFFVAVESERGDWFALHADDQGHAGALARNWVDVVGARGASCWRLLPDGPAPDAFFRYYEDFAAA